MLKKLKLLFVSAMVLSTISCGNDTALTTVQNDISVFSAQTSGNTISANNKTFNLKILSYNVWGLPSPIGKDLKNRMTLIARSINDYDIVNLQETFTDHAKIILEQSRYPHFYRYDNSNLLNINSGLTTLSKYPIIEKKLTKFKDCAGSDCLSNKGVSLTRINVPGLGDVDVYNTHYQAIDSKEDIRIHDNQILQNMIKENDKGNLSIITGDFNFINFDTTDSTSKAYTDFISRFNPIDTFRVANPNDTGVSYDWNKNNFALKDGPLKRLDYIFVLPENRNGKKANYKVEVLESKLAMNKPVEDKFLSDHFGVATTLKITLTN